MPLSELEHEALMTEGLERASILIVDDLPEKLLVFGTLLEELGQNLVFARSGSEALREVLKQEFAVILLDVNMPDMDGFETAALIRRYRRAAHTPIIFITAYADEMQTARGYSLGAVDYILSPVVPEILSSKIKVFVELFLMQRRVRLQADERVALVAAEAARRAAEEGARRSNYLVHASRLLTDSLDVDVAVRKLVTLAVPELGEAAAVIIGDLQALGSKPREQPVQLAFCVKPETEPSLHQLALHRLPDSLLSVCTEVHASRQAADLAEQDVIALSGTLQEEEPRCAAWHPSTGRVVPLIAGDRVLGVLLVAASGARDWGLLEELADRAAIALDNARLYTILQAEIVERRATEVKLQESNQRKDEFLAMLSHELRNPLAPICNAVEVIRRLAPPEAKKLRWANDVMDRQVRHLTRLVEELLDVARISQGKITTHMTTVDLRAVIEHGLETVRPFIERRKHQLRLQLPTEPILLHGDAARLSQVFANLLNNAAKYTEMHGQISLSLKREQGQAIVTVTDNGMGIEPELLPHVFDLFEQGRRSLDRSQGGLGVGLTLVQRMVELHQGRVEVESHGQGQGTTFRVFLPCMEKTVVPPPEPLPVATSTTARPRRVLIVDDNADAAESVSMVLTLLGHEVKTVLDGAQTMACVASFQPDAVVLDIGLPGEDGYSVARRLRAHDATRHTLLIALTGYGRKEDVDKAIEAGFDHHFVKPADPHALANCIAQARLPVRDGPRGGQQTGPRSVNQSVAVTHTH